MSPNQTRHLFWSGIDPSALRPDRPAIVLLHGAGGTSRFWSHQLTGLADRADILAVDLPGHGRSPGPPAERIEQHAQAVLAQIDALALDQPLIGGMSMGGAVALQLLADQPERFAGGLLLSTGAKLKVRPEIFAAIAGDFERYLELVAQTAAAPGADPQVYEPAIQDMRAGGPGLIATDFRACDVFDLRDRVASITATCLVLCGEQDLLTPPKYSDWLAERLPRAKRVRVPGAGHLVAREKPDEVNQAIAAFLSGLPNAKHTGRK